MFMPFFSEILYKSICCGYSFELHRQVDAIQMGTHSICLYKEVAKQYTSCNPKSTELLDCALIGVCAVIRSNTVIQSSGCDDLTCCVHTVLSPRETVKLHLVLLYTVFDLITALCA